MPLSVKVAGTGVKQLDVLDTPTDLAAKIERMASGHEDLRLEDAAFISNMGAGILKFAEIAFPGAEHEEIYAKEQSREPVGKGAHFDVYDQAIQLGYKWLGIYNFSGKVIVTAALLPNDLKQSYNANFPIMDDAAHLARRQYSTIALLKPGADIAVGNMEEHNGLVIAQRADAPFVVHDVVPVDKSKPGHFVKLVIPRSDSISRQALSDDGFERLDTYVTRKLAGEPTRLSGLLAQQLLDGARMIPDGVREVGFGVDGGKLD
jgi:hypothetical protein